MTLLVAGTVQRGAWRAHGHIERDAFLFYQLDLVPPLPAPENSTAWPMPDLLHAQSHGLSNAGPGNEVALLS